MDVPRWPIENARELELLTRVLESDRWGGHNEIVGEFERRFAEFQQCRFGVSAMNGTVTLEMALEAMGIGPGDEVIVPAISFVSTATAVSRVGATPVFVDIEDGTFNIDPACVEAAASARVRAVMAVHFGGPMADMDRLCQVCAARGWTLIEDAAHAHGSEWRGRRAGSIGVVGSFSFQNSKVMTAGEGGILTTNDEALSEKLWGIANQGRRKDGGWFEHFDLGTNYRMTAWQAAVLIAQLERLPEQNELRRRNAEVVRGVGGIRWQVCPEEARVHTNYLTLGTVAGRDAFQKRLVGLGVPCTPFYPHALYANPVFAKAPCRVMPCPVSEARIRDAFWLPHRVLLGDEEQTAFVAEAIGQALEGS